MVSIIIPTYNRKAFLLQAIRSIQNQTYKDFEIIIIDDGSIDGTQEMINSLKDGNINYVKLDKIGNISKLRNYGMKLSKGEYIAFCDDDDIWFPNKLERCLQYINKYDFICSNLEVVNEDNYRIRERFFEDFKEDTIVTIEKLLLRNYVLTSSMLFSKNIFADNIYFDESYYKSTAEDYDFCLRVSLRCPIYFIYENLGAYRTHENLSNEFLNRLQLIKNELKIVSEYKKNHNRLYRKNANIGAIAFMLELFQWYKKNRYYKLAVVQLLKIGLECTHIEVSSFIFKKLFLKLKENLIKH